MVSSHPNCKRLTRLASADTCNWAKESHITYPRINRVISLTFSFVDIHLPFLAWWTVRCVASSCWWSYAISEYQSIRPLARCGLGHSSSKAVLKDFDRFFGRGSFWPIMIPCPAESWKFNLNRAVFPTSSTWRNLWGLWGLRITSANLSNTSKKAKNKISHYIDVT